MKLEPLTQERIEKIAAGNVPPHPWLPREQAMAQELVELRRDRDRLVEELRELRDAISPGRIATPNYYVGIAGRMRQRELQIKPQRSEIARIAGKAGGRGRKKGV